MRTIRNSRKVKDDFEKQDKSIDVGVTFYFDEMMFEQNYEEDYNNGEYGLPEEIDWKLVNEIDAELEDCLCGVIADYFGEYCSYYHGTNGNGLDTTDYDTSCKESVLLKKLKNEIYFEGGEVEDDRIWLNLMNNNSDVYYMFGMAVDERMSKKYTDEASRKIARDLMEVYELNADLYIWNPTKKVRNLVQKLLD